MVYCYQNCSDLLEKKFQAEGENLQIQTVKGQNNLYQQNAFLTCSVRFLTSNKVEQSELKL